MDWEISESTFWEMTIAELVRLIESKKRVQEREMKNRAIFDYTQAELVGRSIARIYNSANKYPSIAEAYPSLFSNEEVEQEIQNKKDELSALRFKQFTQSYNAKFKGGEKSNNE